MGIVFDVKNNRGVEVLGILDSYDYIEIRNSDQIRKTLISRDKKQGISVVIEVKKHKGDFVFDLLDQSGLVEIKDFTLTKEEELLNLKKSVQWMKCHMKSEEELQPVLGSTHPQYSIRNLKNYARNTHPFQSILKGSLMA